MVKLWENISLTPELKSLKIIEKGQLNKLQINLNITIQNLFQQYLDLFYRCSRKNF